MTQITQQSSTVWVNYPKPGETYIHYKGGEYEVLMLAEDDNSETVVVYRSILFGSYHTKPLKMWFENVLVDVKGVKNRKAHAIRFSLKK